MGEHAIDKVVTQLERDPKIVKSKTDHLQLAGTVDWSFDSYKKLMTEYKLPGDTAIYLNRIYADETKNILDTYPQARLRMAADLPFIWAKVYYAVQFESARLYLLIFVLQSFRVVVQTSFLFYFNRSKYLSPCTK
jgi:glycerol-3-phosphate dehydrogenase